MTKWYKVNYSVTDEEGESIYIYIKNNKNDGTIKISYKYMLCTYTNLIG